MKTKREITPGVFLPQQSDGRQIINLHNKINAQIATHGVDTTSWPLLFISD